MAHMAPSPQLIDFRHFRLRHVSDSIWHHMAPHGAMFHVVRHVKRIVAGIWRGLSRLFSISVPCAPCAPYVFPINLCVVRYFTRRSPRQRQIKGV